MRPRNSKYIKVYRELCKFIYKFWIMSKLLMQKTSHFSARMNATLSMSRITWFLSTIKNWKFLKQEVCSQSKSPFCNVVRTFGCSKCSSDTLWHDKLLCRNFSSRRNFLLRNSPEFRGAQKQKFLTHPNLAMHRHCDDIQKQVCFWWIEHHSNHSL